MYLKTLSTKDFSELIFYIFIIDLVILIFYVKIENIIKQNINSKCE
jgi:hypothetical protein